MQDCNGAWAALVVCALLGRLPARVGHARCSRVFPDSGPHYFHSVVRRSPRRQPWNWPVCKHFILKATLASLLWLAVHMVTSDLTRGGSDTRLRETLTFGDKHND